MRTKKVFLVWNILLLVMAMTCLVYYDYRGGLWLKGVTSAWFVLLGTVNLVYAWKSGCKKYGFLLLVELSLILAMTADILLGIRFIAGALVFALGHVVCLGAFCVLQRYSRRDLLITLLIGGLALLVVLVLPILQVNQPDMKVLVGVYAVVISCMLGKAVGNLVQVRTAARWLMMIGGALFWFSDLMLALSLFGRGGRTAGLLCMYTYWPGQSILAFSLFHFVNENCPGLAEVKCKE